MMEVSRAIPCALHPEQLSIALRDIGRMINFDCSGKSVANLTDYGLRCGPGWRGLPPWIDGAELIVRGEEVMLQLFSERTGVTREDMERTAEAVLNGLSGLFGYRTRPYPHKVFCIGWSKTGTTSLTEALRMLGLFAWHTPPWLIGCTAYTDDVSKTGADFSCVADYAALSDLPVSPLFRELDRAFPGSRFILTVREEEGWLESVVAQLEHAINTRGMMGPMARWAYGTDRVDREVLLRRYRQHRREVAEYFQGRKDLLVLDLAERDEWRKLCGFLDLAVPDAPFPHLNIRRSL